MYIKDLSRTELKVSNQKNVIITKIGDLKGSSEEDIIYLLGNVDGKGKNAVYSNMQIIVSDGKNGGITDINLRDIRGYNPKVTLENFKIDKNKEILFTIEDKGNNGYIIGEMYSLDGDKEVKIFDTDSYNRGETYQVLYQDNYKVNLVDINTNINYSIDISKKDKDYLNSIYDSNGKLKKNIVGKVLPVSEISPINLSRNEKIDILSIQKIIGINENDILGNLNCILSFKDTKFEKINSFVAILGEKTANSLLRYEEKVLNNIGEKEHIDFSKVEFIESEAIKDNLIERTIEKEFLLNPEEDKVTYLYNKVKLKDSDSYQVLVYLEGPRFCTERGATLAVLDKINNEYKVISKISNATSPIIISEEKTNGYRNLILKVLDNDREDFRLLKFNGNAYPLDPIKEERIRKGKKIKGIAAISDDLFYTRGIEYK